MSKAPKEQATAKPTEPLAVINEPAPAAATVAAAEPEVPAATVEPLDDFLRRIEGAHIDRDVYAVAATHPEATERVWPGTYSGISLSAGPLSVLYSDGTKA